MRDKYSRGIVKIDSSYSLHLTVVMRANFVLLWNREKTRIIQKFRSDLLIKSKKSYKKKGIYNSI